MAISPSDRATWRNPLMQMLRGAHRFALWLLLLAVFRLCLFAVGVREDREAAADRSDVTQSGSLRFDSLWLYAITNQGKRDGSWRPVLAEMETVRTRLHVRYPIPTNGTDSAWASFSGSLLRSGRVDWQTAIAMGDAAERLTRSIESSAKAKHDRANGLFVVAIAATLLLFCLALLTARAIRRAERSREQLEERFRVLFEKSSDAHLLVDDTGIMDCNDAAVKMLRCSDKLEVLTLHPGALSPEFQPDGRHSLEKCVEMDALARQNGYHRFEWTHRKMDGQLFPVEVTLTPVTIDGKATLLVVWHDLTRRKQAESALEMSHARMEALIEAIPDLMYRVDSNGICLDNLSSNKPFSLTKGVDLVGKQLQDFVPAQVAEIVGNAVAEALVTRKMQSVQYQVYLDGKLRHRDARIVAQSDDVALIVARDVTDSKGIEEELQRSQARFQAFINQGSMVAWITDPDGRIEFLNEPSCEMIGRTQQECLGRTIFDIFSADAASAMLTNIRQVARTGQALETVEAVPLPDGKLHHFLVHGFPLDDLSGRVLVGGTGIDITARREAEQAIRYNLERQSLIVAAQQAIAEAGRDDIETVMQVAVERCQRLAAADGAIVELVDEQEMICEAASGIAEPYLGMRLRIDLSLSGICVRENRLLRCDDVETDSRVDREAYRKAGVRSIVVVPLQKDGRAIGSLKVVSTRPYAFSENDAAALQLLSGFLSSATMTAVAARNLRNSQERLSHAQAMAHLGSWERDYRAGTMDWSDELFRLCGLVPGSIAPSIESLWTYIHPQDRDRAHECMTRAIESGKGVEIEVRLIGADGVLRYVFIRTEIIKDAAGQPIGSRGTLADVTERVIALQEQTKFVSLIENSIDFIAMISLDGELISMNPAGRRLVGWDSSDESAVAALSDFMPEEVWHWIQLGVLPIVMQDERWEGESQLIDVKTGKSYDMQASFFLIRNPMSGEPMCLATVQRDITDKKWLDAALRQNVMLVQEQNIALEWQRQELEALATTDGLTGAKNHRAFQERLAEEFHRAERTHTGFSVVLLDVDQFKQYNDSFGHPEGDIVLKQVVKTLQEAARSTDFVARYGGEEFAVILPETGAEGAMETAERFRAAIEATDWPLRPVTASFGVATMCAHMKTGQDMVDLADKAMYASKKAGRNRVSRFEAELTSA